MLSHFNRRAKAKTERLQEQVIRDFSGMWNTTQNEYNLDLRFFTKFENVFYYKNGTFGPRYGYKEYFQLVSGPRTVLFSPASIGLEQNIVTIRQINHGLSTGSRITVKYTDIPQMAGYLNKSYTVFAENEQEFYFYTQIWQTGSITSGEFSYEVETNVNGDIVGTFWFQERLVFVTDQGIVGYIDDSTAQVIFNDRIANLTAPYVQYDDSDLLTFISGDSTIRINLLGTPLVAGDIIRLRNYTPVSGVSLGRIDTWHEISAVDGNGVYIEIDQLPTASGHHSASVFFSNARGWEPGTRHVVFTAVDDELLIGNGADKPIRVSFTRQIANTAVRLKTNVASYIYDPVSKTNGNTPVGKYVTSGAGYVIWAGLPDKPNRIRISGLNSPYTYTGDPGADNDAVDIDLEKVGNINDDEITGLSFYNQQLVVLFRESMMIGRLGEYTNNVHTPVWSAMIMGYGTISHNAISRVGDTMLAPNRFGVVRLEEGFLQQTIKPNAASVQIDPSYQLIIGGIEQDVAFSIYHINESTYLLFDTTGNVFWYKYVPSLKTVGWGLWTGLAFDTGTVDRFGQIYLAKGSRIYKLGSDTDPVYTDLDQGIEWQVEWPTNDLGTRFRTKQIRYISIDSLGTDKFKAALLVDNLEDEQFTLEFTGGGGPGFGEPEATYGSGRNTASQFLWSVNTKMKLFKLRLYGVATNALRIASISLAFMVGSIRR